MSDQAEDQEGTAAEAVAAEETPEVEAVAAGETPEAEVADAGETTAAEAATAEPTAAAPEPEPEPGATRSRRPSSLRASATPPTFPSSPAFPGSDVQAPVSESAEPGNSGEVPSSGPSLRQRLPLGKLPLNKLAAPKLPLDKLSADQLPVDKLRTLVKQRPEVGLGIAFAGGLVIATMLKRLGRR